MLDIRLVGRLILFALGLLAIATGAQAETPWPSKPVRIVVPFPPGGIVDTVARQLQPRLQSALGQTVLIDNRGGAGGTVGVGEVARAAPDGHTLVLVFDAYATYPLVYPELGYDTSKDLLPVTQIASTPEQFASVLATEQLKWRRLVTERKLSSE